MYRNSLAQFLNFHFLITIVMSHSIRYNKDNDITHSSYDEAELPPEHLSINGTLHCNGKPNRGDFLILEQNSNCSSHRCFVEQTHTDEHGSFSIVHRSDWIGENVSFVLHVYSDCEIHEKPCEHHITLAIPQHFVGSNDNSTLNTYEISFDLVNETAYAENDLREVLCCEWPSENCAPILGKYRENSTFSKMDPTMLMEKFSTAADAMRDYFHNQEQRDQALHKARMDVAKAELTYIKMKHGVSNNITEAE